MRPVLYGHGVLYCIVIEVDSQPDPDVAVWASLSGVSRYLVVRFLTTDHTIEVYSGVVNLARAIRKKHLDMGLHPDEVAA